MINNDNYTLSLHDALPIYKNMHINISENMDVEVTQGADVVFGDLINSLYQTEQAIRNNDTDAISEASALVDDAFEEFIDNRSRDRKSTRLNSSHVAISYAVFCLKKKII